MLFRCCPWLHYLLLLFAVAVRNVTGVSFSISRRNYIIVFLVVMFTLNVNVVSASLLGQWMTLKLLFLFFHELLLSISNMFLSCKYSCWLDWLRHNCLLLLLFEVIPDQCWSSSHSRKLTNQVFVSFFYTIICILRNSCPCWCYSENITLMFLRPTFSFFLDEAPPLSPFLLLLFLIPLRFSFSFPSSSFSFPPPPPPPHNPSPFPPPPPLPPGFFTSKMTHTLHRPRSSTCCRQSFKDCIKIFPEFLNVLNL